MAVELTANESGTITVENIGGIKETAIEFNPGVTVLEGRNATNRTSFLQAVMGALGSDDVHVKGDADEAHVEMQLGGPRRKGVLRGDTPLSISYSTPDRHICLVGDID